jgi:hypothetical protein
MTRSTQRLPCELLLTVVLISIVFYSLAAEAMLLGQSAGTQQPGFGPDSTIAQAIEGFAELGTTYTTTSPGAWQQVLSRNSPYFTNDHVISPNGTLQRDHIEFEPPLRFDDTEDGDALSPQPWPENPDSHDQFGHDVNSGDNSILEEPSPVQTFLDDFERQQQDAMFPTTESSSYDFPSLKVTSPVEELIPSYGDLSARSTSPPSSLVDFHGSERNLRLSPDNSLDGMLTPENQTNAITDSFLSGPFNFGDRFHPQVGLEHYKHIVETSFKSENTPPQPHLYPPSIPPDDAFIYLDPISPTPATSKGKKVYVYTCATHGLVFNQKELTMYVHPERCSPVQQLTCYISAHFQTVHKRTDVTLTSAHPCTHPDCTRSFRHPKDLKKHQPTHTRAKHFSCVCGHTYTRKDNLIRHQNGSTGSRPCDAFKRQQQQQV